MSLRWLRVTFYSTQSVLHYLSLDLPYYKEPFYSQTLWCVGSVGCWFALSSLCNSDQSDSKTHQNGGDLNIYDQTFEGSDFGQLPNREPMAYHSFNLFMPEQLFFYLALTFAYSDDHLRSDQYGELHFGLQHDYQRVI